MAVIFEMRGKSAALGDLGMNLYSGCAVGCRFCYYVLLNRTTWEKWTSGARPRRKILVELEREAKKMADDPREILVCPACDPYQSDEAARLTRKALLILEQYHLRVQVATQCGMRSATDFDILARNRWKYSVAMYFQSERLREQWEPGAAPVAERMQALRAAHAAGIFTSVHLHPIAYPAELIDVVEALRADVDVWNIGRPPPGEPPPKPKIGQRPGFVDADTVLAHLRRMVEKGLSERLPNVADEMNVWSPAEKDTGKGGEPR